MHYWGEDGGPAWLQPFFKRHALARRDVQVLLLDRKLESVEKERGDDFLFGAWLPDEFPRELFVRKWERRYDQEPDDWTAAPQTNAGFCWAGLESHSKPWAIPWAALKSAWRRAGPGKCTNCELPTLLVNFGRPWGMFGARNRLDYVCRRCERVLEDFSIRDAGQWMLTHLDPECLPSRVMTGHYGSAPWPGHDGSNAPLVGGSTG